MATLTKSFQLLGQQYIGKSGGTLYVRIYARYSEQDIANNRTYVIYEARSYYENSTYISDQQGRIGVSGDGASYQGASCTRPTTGETVSVSTGGWIYHNSDGTKSINCAASISFPNWGWNNTAYGSASLPTIPRQAKINSAPNFNDEENPTITYNNTAGNSVSSLDVCISLTGSKDDIKYRAISKTGTSYTFNLTDAEREVLRKATLSGSNKRNVKFFVRTEIGGKTYYSTLDRTLTIINANPVFTDDNVNYYDSNNDVVNITENDKWIVRNNSNLKIDISSAIARKNADIQRYEAILNGVKKTLTEAGTFDFGTINLSNDSELVINVIDNRGLITTVKKNITIFDWINPSAVINYGRINNYEDETKIKIQSTISSVNNKNMITSIVYRYKKNDETEYSQDYILSDNTECIVSINKLYAWNFQIVVSDKFGSTIYNFSVAKGVPIMFMDTKNLAVGINKFPSNNNAFDVDGNLNVNGEIKQYNKPLNKLHIARMNTNRTPIDFTSEEQVTGWENPINYGDYTADVLNDRIIIRNTEVVEISGATGGRGNALIDIEIKDDNGNQIDYIVNAKTLMNFGDVYWTDSLKTSIFILDPTKTYYLTMLANTYSPSSSFSMNNGFGKNATWLQARKLKQKRR